MVSHDSARQWYPRERFIACDTDHFDIARLQRGESGIYQQIKQAIKRAILGAGAVDSNADDHRGKIVTSQPYESEMSDEYENYDARHLSIVLGARSCAPAVGPPQLQLDDAGNQGDDGHLQHLTRRPNRLQSSTNSS